MSEKIKWDVEHLKKENAQQRKRITNNESRIRTLESFKDSTVEKLITIFNTIEEIKEESRWLKRNFTNTLVGGIVSVVVALIIWLIQT